MIRFAKLTVLLAGLVSLALPDVGSSGLVAGVYAAAKPLSRQQIGDQVRDPVRDGSDVQSERAHSSLILESEAGGGDRRGGVTTRIENGVRTTTATERERDVRIVEDPRNGITVTVIRHYGPEDRNRLQSRHPELTDYVEMFPREFGNHRIELNLSITSTYHARDLAQLQAKHPEAFRLVRRYRRSR